jgi:hypothetical protein
LRAAIQELRPALAEILNYKRGGAPFRNAVLVAPIFGPGGDLEYYLGSQMEVEPHREERGKDRVRSPPGK